jgi:hypothetical protein
MIKRWPPANEPEIPDIPYLTFDEGIQRLREAGMLEWICHVKSTPHWAGPEDVLFVNTVENRFVREDWHPQRALSLLFSVWQTLQWEPQSLNWEI